jgi:hypothetical protein
MDNTSKDNKNKKMVFFLAKLLLLRKVRGKIFINFLPVGHTHEDVDALFAQISYMLTIHGALTIPDLTYLIESCRQQRPHVETIDSVVDFWRWISEMGIPTDLHGLANSRSYELSLASAGHVLLRAKPNMSDSVECFSRPIVIMPAVPSPLPPIVFALPFPLNITTLSGMVMTLQSRLSPIARLWWQQYLEGLDAKLQLACPECTLLKQQERDIVIHQKDSNSVKTRKRGERERLAHGLIDHHSRSPTCVRQVPLPFWLLSADLKSSSVASTTSTSTVPA